MLHKEHKLILMVSVVAVVIATKYKFKISSENEVSTRQSLSKCIIEASKRFFDSNFAVITVSLPLVSTDANLVSSVVLSQLVLPILEEEYRWTLLIRNLYLSVRNTKQYSKKSYSYIVQIRQEGEVTKNVKKLKGFRSWNPHAKFLVVSSTLFQNPHRVAVEVVQALWKFNVINVAVLLVDEKNQTNFKVYSWRPYNEYSCASNFTTVGVVDDCSFGIILRNVSWFDDRIPKNLFNCSVKVNYHVWPPFVNDVENGSQISNSKKNLGIEINLLNMVADILNLHTIYNRTVYRSWGHVFENGSATRDLKHLLNNEIDIVVGGYVCTPSVKVYLDTSLPYIQDAFEWCVSHEPIVVGLETISSMFSLKEWSFICLIYFTVSLFTWFASNFSEDESGTYKTLINSFQVHFSILLGFAVKVLPQAIKIRGILAMYLIFSYALNLEYSSYLTSSLSAHYYKEKYGKVDDIYKYNLETYFISNTIFFFKGFDDGKRKIPTQLMLQNWRNCSNTTTCLTDLVSNKKSATCFPRLHRQYLVNNNKVLRKQKGNFHCLKETEITLPINMIMRKGFPLYKAFDDVLNGIISAGFIVKWQSDNNLGDKKSRYEPQGYEEKIKYSNLAPVFRMLLYGLGVSFIFFLAENIVHRKIV